MHQKGNQMEILKENEYEDLAMEFQYKIVELLDKTLKAKGIEDSLRNEICGDYNFELANFIDEGEIDFDDESYSLEIAFEKEGKLWVNSGVLFHEYAFGVSSDYFENTDA
jgi:hypothetical protein